jgi:hypothetical protein
MIANPVVAFEAIVSHVDLNDYIQLMKRITSEYYMFMTMWLKR